MNSSYDISQHSSGDLTREELADVAYMCYILDRTQTTRWYHEWRVALDRMGREGWTMKGLYYRGLVRQKIEQVYGLSPFHSRRAVKAYPPVNTVSTWDSPFRADMPFILAPELKTMKMRMRTASSPWRKVPTMKTWEVFLSHER